MSETTDFAGLTALLPGDPLGVEFLRTNIWTIDRLLAVGAVTHRHDGHAALADPPQDEDTGPALLIDPVGGMIPADLGIYVGYTWVDADGGETILSDASLVSTEPGLVAPTTAPTLALDHAAGGLLANTYTYGLTVSDGLGGETPLGATAQITVPPGFATSEVVISGLTAILTETGGAEWRLYRARGAGNFTYLTSGSGDSVTDDNTLCPQCDQTPPVVGTTADTNKLIVTLPAADWPTGVAALKLYASINGSFVGPSLLGTYVPADAGTDQTFTALVLQDEQPPTVNLSIPGANLIDPDTELVDFHWKRPVADAASLPTDAAEGDVRITLDDGSAHIFSSGAWAVWVAGTGGHTILDETGAAVTPRTNLQFTGSGVAVTDDGVDTTIVTFIAGSGGGAFTYRGTWDVATAYVADDFVQLNGSSYVAVAATTGDDPSTDDGSHWELVAAAGADGADGAPGADGADGAPGADGYTPARADVAGTATALAASAEANLDMTLGKGYTLYKIVTNRAARVRVYANAAYRTADAARAIGTDPTGDHGLLLEIVTTAGQLSYALAPPVVGYNLEGPVTDQAAVRITNMGATGDTTVTFTTLITEP